MDLVLSPHMHELHTAPAPENVRISCPVHVFVNDVPFNATGGTLFVTESVLIWWSGETGFALEYPSIVLHAIQRDPASFEHPALYLQLATGDDEDAFEVRFCPADTTILDRLFAEMAACQALHPDPQEDGEGDDDGFFMGDEDDDEDDGEGDGEYEGLSVQGQAVLDRLGDMCLDPAALAALQAGELAGEFDDVENHDDQ